MNHEKILPITLGILKNVPGMELLLNRKTGGTISSRYCYSVWLRHLVHAHKYGLRSIPKTVAELGPGDSIGIGLAALLSGVQEYFALDVIKYWDAKRNTKIFDELLELFINRENIPDNREFPRVKPELDDYSFPSTILSEDLLEKSLSQQRINQIRSEISNLDENNKSKFIHYYIPWDNINIIKKDSVDFIYSQAVLEHVEDLEKTYSAMYSWLKDTGIISHTIDFKCHGTTRTWNGHWAFSDFEWKIVKGRKKFLINRSPFTTHINLLNKYDFEIFNLIKYKNLESSMPRKHLTGKFKNLSQEELTTSEMFIQATRK